VSWQKPGRSVAHESRILVESLVLAIVFFFPEITRHFSIALDHTRSRLDHSCASLPGPLKPSTVQSHLRYTTDTLRAVTTEKRRISSNLIF
jgi:hypothetical protein